MTISDSPLAFYFMVITTTLWVSIYTVITFFGNVLSDITSNGNIIVPFIVNLFSWIISIIHTVTLGAIDDALYAFYDQIAIFFGVWNIVPINIFYLIFIPFASIVMITFIEFIKPNK